MHTFWFKYSFISNKKESDVINHIEYANIIGSLRYVTNCTRPDILYAVGVICRFTSRPSIDHWNAICRLLRYLKRTIHVSLFYKNYPAVLEDYCDADWNTPSSDSMSITGYISLAN